MVGIITIPPQSFVSCDEAMEGRWEMAAEATLEGPEIGGFDLGPPRLSSWATHPTH